MAVHLMYCLHVFFGVAQSNTMMIWQQSGKKSRKKDKKDACYKVSSENPVTIFELCGNFFIKFTKCGIHIPFSLHFTHTQHTV